ncbi:MAG: methyltransferase [Gammaproteobacteria bacterium]|jgi:ubiquinone/menaquinone biosynthesis C-methylase UbiE|nr:methyltransferase [Gammaproteobacteria bacterium]
MTEIQKTNKLLELSMMFIAAKAIHLATELDFQNKISEKPISISDLARQLNYDKEGLFKLLRLLEAYEIVHLEDNQVSASFYTPLLNHIDSPHLSLNYMNVNNLAEAFKHNKGVFEQTYHQSFYSYIQKHELIEKFEQWCTLSAKEWLPAVIDMYDFSPYQNIADLGGGQGYLLSMILNKFKDCKAVLFDQKEVVKTASPVLNEYGVADRVTLLGGNFFDASSIPTGRDLYITCRTLLNWSDQDAVNILNNCYEAMPKGSKFIIIDFYIPEKDHPHYKRALLSDTALLALMTSSNRTLAKWKTLISQSKLSLNQVYTSEGNSKHEPIMPLFVIETIKK